MKRTLLTPDAVDALLEVLPVELFEFVQKATVYDSSCSPEAHVYFLDREDGYYLKTCKEGTLRAEADMTAYFHTKGLAAEVLDYRSYGGKDYLLTSRVRGEDCTHAQYLSDPKRLCDLLAERLRMLHETDFEHCPVQSRMESYLALADQNYRTGNYDQSAFPDSFGYRSAEEAYTVLNAGRHSLRNEVLLHGDYCLPNIMLDDWRFSAFIDLGNGGVGDRHVDLFWGAWTLWFNLKTDQYRNRFFDAYGRDRIDTEKLQIIAAAEVFG